MAAGGITITHPDTISLTGNVKRIVWNDSSNTQHELKAVYWCPDGVNAYKVWPVSSYVKYILHFSWENYGTVALHGIEVNNALAASTITNGRKRQKNNGQYEAWSTLDQSTLSALGNGESNTGIYGVEIELEITISDATSFGIRFNQYYIGDISTYNFEIIGIDANNNETSLYTETINADNLKGQTKTITL